MQINHPLAAGDDERLVGVRSQPAAAIELSAAPPAARPPPHGTARAEQVNTRPANVCITRAANCLRGRHAGGCWPALLSAARTGATRRAALLVLFARQQQQQSDRIVSERSSPLIDGGGRAGRRRRQRAVKETALVFGSSAAERALRITFADPGGPLGDNNGAADNGNER